MRKIIGLALIIPAFSATAQAAEHITLLAGNQDPKLISAAVDEFEQAYPDIQVDLMLEAWDAVDDKYSTLTAAGNAPDILINNSVYGWAKYAYEGLFTDLSPLVQRDKAALHLDEFFPVAIEQSKIGGKLYGMPTSPATGFAVTYNATLFDQAGVAHPPTDWNDASWNWDAMVAAAKKLTKVNGNNQATQFGVDEWDADGPLLSASYAFGGDWFDAQSYQDGIIHQVTLNTDANARAFQAFADLRTKAQVRPGGDLAGPEGGFDSFADGKIAMWLEVAQLEPASSPTAKNYKWGFAPYPFPAGSSRDRISTWGGGGFAAISSSSKHVEAAWTFLRWVAAADRNSNPALAKWMLIGGPRSSWINGNDVWYRYDLSAQSQEQMLQVLEGAATRAVALPRQTIAGASEVWDVVNDQMGDALHGDAAVASSLAKAQAAAEAAVKELKSQLANAKANSGKM